MKRSRMLGSLLPLTLLLTVVAAMPTSQAAPSLGKQEILPLEFVRQVDVSKVPRLRGEPPPISQPFGTHTLPTHDVASTQAAPTLKVPEPAPTHVTSNTPGLFGQNGLTHYDSRLASNGNQFSVEPPDQGLAVSDKFIFESVNIAVQVRTKGGVVTLPTTSLNDFYGEDPPITRTNPPSFGPFIFDPHGYYDVDTDRWFLVVVSLLTDPDTGGFTGQTALLLAVSATGDPNTTYNIYKINTTFREQRNCPCFADYPKLGADKYGLYIGANEFPVFAGGFKGADLYAMSKMDLAAGVATEVVKLSSFPKPFHYTVHPAQTPSADYELAEGGTEYFLTLNPFGLLNNDIAVYALTNTSSLDTPTPSLNLQMAVLESETYGLPPFALQKDGKRPLGDVAGEPVGVLDTRVHRMNDVKFADGAIWSGTNTIVGSPERAAIAWFIVRPSIVGGLTASISNQGYLAAPGENSVIYPGFAVNADGSGMMVFTLTGPDYFPSAGYTRITEAAGTEKIHIGQAGFLPDDGFTCYAAFGGDGTCRWGDYSQAAATPSGLLIGATEYIPNHPRTQLANWGTFIMRLAP